MNLARQAVPGDLVLSCLAGPPTGPAMLFLHGVARNAEDYAPLATSLLSDIHVHALDFRGHGESDPSPQGAYRVIDYVEDVGQALRNLHLPPCFLYGHSLGAMVALASAARWPERIRGLILEDPPMETMGRRIAGSAWEALFRGMQQIAQTRGAVAEMQEALSNLEIPNGKGERTSLGQLRDVASLTFSAWCLTQADPRIFTPILAGQWLHGYDLSDWIHRVHCPVLLLQGDPPSGGALTHEDAQSLHKALPACALTWFQGCGHLIHRERPAEVLDLVRHFCRQSIRSTLARHAPNAPPPTNSHPTDNPQQQTE